MPGTLYIVATPIGNLEDITLRALRVLREADVIACEDTRHTGKLLEHYQIDRPLRSFHEHNERARALELVGELEAGQSVALVSDAGTPLISDPGYSLVSLARERGVAVVPVPGASAAIAALSASGLPTDAFLFRGFLPAKAGQRRKVLEGAKAVDATLVFYEAPHRILECLEDVAAVFGKRRVMVARELTKVYEEFVAGTGEEVRGRFAERGALKGEFVILIAKAEGVEEHDRPLAERVAELMAQGVPRMDALKQAAREYGVSKREAYKEFGEREGA